MILLDLTFNEFKSLPAKDDRASMNRAESARKPICYCKNQFCCPRGGKDCCQRSGVACCPCTFGANLWIVVGGFLCCSFNCCNDPDSDSDYEG